MGKLPLSNKNTFLLILAAGIFSIFTLATISTLPMDKANAVTYTACDTGTSSYQIDNAPNDSFCDYDRDISSDGFEDCINGVNCKATTSFKWKNDEWNTYYYGGKTLTERADIDINLNQLLECGKLSSFECRNNVLNQAFHKVDVQSLGTANSFARFQVDMDMEQKTDGSDQKDYQARNIGQQIFEATVKENAKLLADTSGDENVQFVMDQFNNGPDNSINLNAGILPSGSSIPPTSSLNPPASQSYKIISEGGSIVNLLSEQGFALNQKNDECDISDEALSSGANLALACVNRSDQSLVINTDNALRGSTATATNYAKVTFDTERSDGSDLSTTTQINNCENGFGNYDEGSLTCENQAITKVGINAERNSQVNMGGIIQDIYQKTDCSGSADIVVDFCVNQAEVGLEVNADQSGVVDVDSGIQDVEQTISSCSTADCINQGALLVQIGSLTAPVTGNVNTDYKQILDQNLDCDDTCINQATIKYLVNAIDDASISGKPTVNSESTQIVEQNSECKSDQTCSNTATMTNTVSAGSTISPATTSVLNADTYQYISQDCSDFYGDSCSNTATMENTISSLGSSKLTADTDQTIIQDCTGYTGSSCTNVDMVTSTGTTFTTANLNYFADQTVYNGATTSDSNYQINIAKTGNQPVTYLPPATAIENPTAPTPTQNQNNVNNVAYTTP